MNSKSVKNNKRRSINLKRKKINKSRRPKSHRSKTHRSKTHRSKTRKRTHRIKQRIMKGGSSFDLTPQQKEYIIEHIASIKPDDIHDTEDYRLVESANNEAKDKIEKAVEELTVKIQQNPNYDPYVDSMDVDGVTNNVVPDPVIKRAISQFVVNNQGDYHFHPEVYRE